MYLDPARGKTACVALCQPVELWKKYCLHSPTLDEEPLQQAILGAINASMDNRTVLESRITAVMEQELLPVAGETMSLADVERALEDLGRQFDSLLKEAASPERQEEYTERFRTVRYPPPWPN